MVVRDRSSSVSLWLLAIICHGVECHGRRGLYKTLRPISVRGGSNAPYFQEQPIDPQQQPTDPTNIQQQFDEQQQQPFDAQQSTWLGEDPFLEQEKRQTVQERVDAWRQRQQQLKQEGQGLDQRIDDQGRMSLLAGTSKASRAITFFILMWRDVHLYEVADQSFRGLTRLFLVLPLMALFVANMAGTVASITSPNHSTHKRLKAILNLDKVVEAILLIYYLLRLTVLPSSSAPREIFIANTLHSVFFILQCHGVTRLNWDNMVSTNPAPVTPSMSTSSTYPSSYPQYDDDLMDSDPRRGYSYSAPDAPKANYQGQL